MPRQKREYIEESSHDTSESDESNSSDNNEILEVYNDDSSDGSDKSESESTQETINGRPINKKKIVKKEYNYIRDVMIEYINKKYAYAKLGEFDVVMMVKNGYINATKLCRKNGKDFFDWTRLKGTKILLNHLDRLPGIPGNPIIVVKSGDNLTRGSYVHQLLIIHVATWCSAEYAIKVSKIVNEYHIKQAISIKDKLLNKKQDKIDELIIINKKIDKRMRQLLEDNEEFRKDNEEFRKDNEILKSDNEDFRRRDDIMSSKVDHLVNEIDIKSDNYVVEGNPNTRHILVIIKTNELPHKLRNKKGKFMRDVNGKTITSIPQFDYIALRVMKKSYKSRINSIKKEFPDMDILLEIKYTPNSMNLWSRIKKELNRKKIAVTGSRFKRLVGYSEKRMIREIQKIHDERYEYDDE